MSASVQEKDRHVFPRWRSFKATSRLGELALPAVELEVDTSELDVSLAKGVAGWKGDPSLWRGLDLLGTAVVAGRLQDFAALVAEIRDNPLAPIFARNVLGRTLAAELDKAPLSDCDGISNVGARQEIRASRVRLASAPRDAIEWTELARAYTIAGLNDKASKAIAAALHLSPSNRFVLRSAARFFLHCGEKERALALLGKAPTIKHDPWILASEIAIADSLGKASRHSRLAREKVGMDIAPSELTELASALGSLEAESGNHRNARRFLRQALVGANENSIAQIGWLNRSRLGEWVDASKANPPLLHEANAWNSFYKGEFEAARQESLCWFRDQPFASAPAALGSYILADIFWDYKGAKELAQAGLRSNPDDLTLLNNLAVCLMELDELTEAEAALSRVKAEGRGAKIDSTYKATFGMLAFRKGDHVEGRRLYLEAIEGAKNSGSKQNAARAAFHLVFEEIVAQSGYVEDSIRRLREFEGIEGFKEWPRFFERVNALMRAGVESGLG
ncbi:MAG TPA: tetratricopeptide repeat protein [Terracidiphilus sp.]|jgi:tetratricopeptide (TPR) repeat protein|nr:tetratricopeptide repeat protein [Terracidiphilus sp.]